MISDYQHHSPLVSVLIDLTTMNLSLPNTSFPSEVDSPPSESQLESWEFFRRLVNQYSNNPAVELLKVNMRQTLEMGNQTDSVSFDTVENLVANYALVIIISVILGLTLINHIDFVLLICHLTVKFIALVLEYCSKESRETMVTVRQYVWQDFPAYVREQFCSRRRRAGDPTGQFYDDEERPCLDPPPIHNQNYEPPNGSDPNPPPPNPSFPAQHAPPEANVGHQRENDNGGGDVNPAEGREEQERPGTSQQVPADVHAPGTSASKLRQEFKQDPGNAQQVVIPHITVTPEEERVSYHLGTSSLARIGAETTRSNLSPAPGTES